MLTLRVGVLAAYSVVPVLLLAAATRADNVDLSTVPKRNTVQLTIYNSEDLTLVRETRAVTFKRGANPLQFSWAGTLIDPSSVELRFVTHVDALDVLDTTFPHDKPQMLYWNVNSQFDGEATIQISYFTSGISWKADYIAIATADEATMNVDGFVRITNNSGEEYEDAEVRLVVGTINLVEKIAQLAQVSMKDVGKLEDSVRDEFKLEATKGMIDRYARGGRGGDAREPAGAAAPKEIIKEGLSEYFIYSIEGTETIPNGWSKRMRSFEGKGVPVKIVYRYRPREYGDQLVRMYLATNNEQSKLGTTPLPDGVVRVFRDNGRDGLAYLTQQPIKYIPVGEKIELNLGPDPEVIFELIKKRAFRDEIWLRQNDTTTYRKVGDGGLATVDNSAVAGWDDHNLYDQRIRNYTAKRIDVEVRREFGGDVIFRSQLEPTLFDYQTVEYHTSIDAAARKDLLYEVLQHQGYAAKQNRVLLEAGRAER